jgi:hypothetical protein
MSMLTVRGFQAQSRCASGMNGMVSLGQVAARNVRTLQELLKRIWEEEVDIFWV